MEWIFNSHELVKIFGDNQDAVALAKDPVYRQSCKHTNSFMLCVTTDVDDQTSNKTKLEKFKRLLFRLLSLSALCPHMHKINKGRNKIK